jgi:hypothetical protein
VTRAFFLTVMPMSPFESAASGLCQARSMCLRLQITQAGGFKKDGKID